MRPTPKDVLFREMAGSAQAPITADTFKPLPGSRPQPLLRRDQDGRIEANPAVSARSCRYPVEVDDTTHACCNVKVVGLQYCEEHARRVFDFTRVARRHAVLPTSPPTADSARAKPAPTTNPASAVVGAGIPTFEQFIAEET